MAPSSKTWIVMLRDVSASVRVQGEPQVVAALVLEAETGLVLGARVASEGPDALAQVLVGAATEPPGTLPPSRPGAVVCARGMGDAVGEALTAFMAEDQLPPIHESDPVLGAEDVFDSFLGHLAGRNQPQEPPEPEDWSAMFEAALLYREQAPWERWSDAVHLRLELHAPDGPARYVCVVLGAEGIQRGLLLFPGDELPADFSLTARGASARPPAGSLMLLLDSPAELPAELAAKALRYGWPGSDEVVPAFISMGTGGPSDPSRRDVHHLSAGAAAVAAHDRRGPIVVGAASATSGELGVSEGGRVTFTIAVPVDRSAASGAGAGTEGDPANRPDRVPGGDATIDTLLDAFLADQRERLAVRTWRTYETVIGLLADCLNGYGHLSLGDAERQRWEAAYEQDEDAFVHLFGADKIADNLGEFLGYFMIRKVAAGESLLRAAGTVTKKLSVWLAEHGHLDADRAGIAAERGAEASRELPKAERLSRLLHEHARRSSIDVRDLDDADYVEDFLTIDRVEPGRLWLENGIGPVAVPTAASAIAQPGWSMSVVLARRGGRWHLADVGNVYP